MHDPPEPYRFFKVRNFFTFLAKELTSICKEGVKIMKVLNFKMKNEKGITLIALVITIIVLLILAAVSISMLTGENRNFKKSCGSKK